MKKTITTRASVHLRRSADSDSSREVGCVFRWANYLTAVEQSDEVRKLFLTPTPPSEIREGSPREVRQVFGVRLARMYPFVFWRKTVRETSTRAGVANLRCTRHERRIGCSETPHCALSVTKSELLLLTNFSDFVFFVPSGIALFLLHQSDFTVVKVVSCS